MRNQNPATPPPLPESYGLAPAPVKTGMRVAGMDVLRGFALLGILIANMLYFSQPVEPMDPRAATWMSSWDRIADWFCLVLVEGKFYPIFSLLFGVGVFLQTERISRAGGSSAGFYMRRLLVLGVFGLLHGILLWDGDVLLCYAAGGFLLLLFRNRRTVTLLVWAGFLILVPVGMLLLSWLVVGALSNDLKPGGSFSNVMNGEPAERMELFRVFASGGYLETVFYRLRNFLWSTLGLGLFFSGFVGMFLVGMAAARKTLLQDVSGNRKFIIRVLVIAGITGFLINLVAAQVVGDGAKAADFGGYCLGYAFLSLGGPILGIAYAAGILLLVDRAPGGRLFSMVGACGRMALTNYVLQSLIATTIFYGYGFGLAGEVGRLGTLGIALGIFVSQVVASEFWLARFQFGPLEWVWRSLTYGKRQWMRKEGVGVL